jgi:hypothetical protein
MTNFFWQELMSAQKGGFSYNKFIQTRECKKGFKPVLNRWLTGFKPVLNH